VGKAFHFFDMDDNRSIDFIEFFSGLDKLRIKISEADAYKCFLYLNSKKDGEIDYN
jgi:Ca2+-binding EF-hand superfamily protein